MVERHHNQKSHHTAKGCLFVMSTAMTPRDQQRHHIPLLHNIKRLSDITRNIRFRHAEQSDDFLFLPEV